ncbi:uncharacterized protein METZ01_LOCUS37679 [marine metagenome]|uniref:Uncharacterized protein n=1 Tax=marine metagenome TaxID=408172 RepID=A0A381QZE2_9ZZZZ
MFPEIKNYFSKTPEQQIIALYLRY